jgi:hypothetical protein
VDDNDDSTPGQSTDQVDVTAGEAVADSPVTADEGDNVAKKAKKAKSAKKTKADKAPKTAKAPKTRAAKVRDVDTDAAAAPRKRVPAAGELNSVIAKGETYIELQFTEGQVTLTPTSNRVHNRDLVVATLNKLLG